MWSRGHALGSYLLREFSLQVLGRALRVRGQRAGWCAASHRGRPNGPVIRAKPELVLTLHVDVLDFPARGSELTAELIGPLSAVAGLSHLCFLGEQVGNRHYHICLEKYAVISGRHGKMSILTHLAFCCGHGSFHCLGALPSSEESPKDQLPQGKGCSPRMEAKCAQWLSYWDSCSGETRVLFRALVLKERSHSCEALCHRGSLC